MYAIDAGRLLDDGRWTAYQQRLVFLTALAIIFDGADNQLLGTAVPAMMREWQLARAAFAPVLALGLVGMMIGGAVAGLAGDRLGRKTALVGSVVVFGLATAAAAAVHGIAGLSATRFLAGVGLGGALPNAAALASEFVPKRHRAIAVTRVGFGKLEKRRPTLGIEDHSRVLRMLLREITGECRPRRTLLVGHSAGADQLLRMMHDEDGAGIQVDGLIALGPNVSLDTCFATRLYAKIDAANPDGTLAILKSLSEHIGSLETWLVVQSYFAQMTRANTMHHRDWLPANEARHRMRRKWAAFFKEWDLLLCPVAASAAFPHDQVGERHERTIEVNGQRVPTTDQLFWAGLTCMVYLPATVAPVGLAPGGLPVGVQIAGPQYGDRTCIAFARLLEREYQAFVPPPGFRP